MLLCSGISILVSAKLSVLYLQYAHMLLQAVVYHFGDIYGKDARVYNVHSLVHLAHDVKQYGCLDHNSVFPYENHLQKLKKLVRKPERPLAQILCRLSEQTTRKYVNHTSNILKKPTLLDLFLLSLQLKELKDVFSIGDQICMIDNIVECYDGLYVVRICKYNFFCM